MLSGGFDPVTRKRRRISRTFRGTKREAEREATRLQREIDSGAFADAGRLTVAQYLERWLEHARTRTRGTTWARYRQLVSGSVLPRIGRVKLAKLRPSDVQAVVDGMLAEGLSPRTTLHAYRVLSASLATAVRWQLLSANPAAAIRPPRPERPELTVADATTIEEVIRAAEGDRFHAALVVAATTGLRRGELLGLRWRDVDLDGARLGVMASLQRVGDELALLEPKTDRSRRGVSLPAIAVETLRRHRKAQAERRLLVGEAWHDLGLVFDRGDGSPVEPGELSHALKRAARKAGVPDLRLHDLRHYYATALLKANVHPEIVSEQLGHSTISITLDTYSHVLPGMGEVAAQAIQATLGTALEGGRE